MKIRDVFDDLIQATQQPLLSGTVDVCKAGNPEAEVNKVAVSMFATVDVIRQAAAWGAQMLLVHEPTYYNHEDHHSDESLECEKRALIESLGLTVYRYHDYPHSAHPDMITAGMLRDMQLDCTVSDTDTFDLTRLYLKQPMTPRQLARHLEEKLDIAHIKIAGAADTPCTEISCMFGTPGGVYEELQNPECEILIIGELCEWALGEYARDAGLLGRKKAALVLGHIGSERNGMKYIADLLRQRQPQLDVRYFECGEVYTYTDR